MHRFLLAAAFLALAAPAAAQEATPPSTPAEEITSLGAEEVAAEETLESDDTTLRLPPVVVTARKFEELNLEVPMSISVIPEQTIQDAGLRSIDQVSQLVPNMNMVEFTARRLSFPFIRGVGSGQGDPAVTTYIDGVPQLAISSTNLRLLDVERVEVLRGPQGTLYGRNSIGGLIHVISKRPSDEPEFKATGTWGNYSLQEYTLSYSTPLVEDTLYLGLSGMYLGRDGYTTNNFTNNDVDDRDSFLGRAQLLWTPDEKSEVRFQMYGERTRDGGFTLSDIVELDRRPYRIDQDFEGKTNRNIFSSSLTYDYFGETVDFTSITAYVDWDSQETSDFDFSTIDGIRRRTDESQDYVSQELRFASPADVPTELNERASLRWQAGALLFDSNADRSATNDFRPGGAGILFPPAAVGKDRAEGEFDDRAIGVFGELTMTLDDRLDLTAGVRYDYQRVQADIDRSFESFGFIFPTDARREDESFDEWIPRFSVAYRWREGLMAYGTAARGWKAGGFNLTSPPGETSFGPETSWTYEAGVKSSWLDDRLLFSAAVFYIDWDDMQLSQFDALAGGYVTNAGESTSKGVELEWTARPVAGLDIFGGFGYVDTEFDDYVDSFGADASGNKLPFAPETTLNVGAQYGAPIGGGNRFFVRGEYVNIGTFYYDAGNLEGESYQLANFRLGLEGRNWRVEGWMRNAFGEEYVPVALQPSPFDPTGFVGRNGPPRTFGVTASLRF